MIDTIGRRKGKFFSSLDLMKGYHQVKLAEQSKQKNVFSCHKGLFLYRRMPFGLANAPATSQRLINQLFSGIDWEFVFTYLDDILIVSKSFEKYLSHVRRVLERLQEAGLRLKPEKCAFVKSEIDCLGFTLSATGVRPNFKKVEAIQHFPRQKPVKDVQSFLGMVNSYRRHVPNMAVKARPCHPGR